MSQPTNIFRLLARAVLVAGLITAPLLLVSQVNAGDRAIIEAPGHKKLNGAGLVLLVSLQRS